jgi:hypothetical protein
MQQNITYAFLVSAAAPVGRKSTLGINDALAQAMPKEGCN